MLTASGTMAPKATLGPTAARSALEYATIPASKAATLWLTALRSSMSGARPSKCWPPGVLKLMTAIERRTSRLTSAKPGRYQPTTRIPWSWARSMTWAVKPAPVMSSGRFQRLVWRYRVCTPRFAIAWVAWAGSMGALVKTKS